MTDHIGFPEAVEAASRMDQLSGSLHAVHDPGPVVFAAGWGVRVGAQTVPKAVLPCALVNVAIAIVISTEATSFIPPPFACVNMGDGKVYVYT